MNHAESRASHAIRGGMLVGLCALLGLVTGCSKDQSDPAAGRPDRPTIAPDGVLEANANALPEFQRYMLGDLPSPGPTGRDPFGGRSAIEAPLPLAAPSSPSAPSAPNLRGIVRSQGRLVALFDRGSASTGETVSGWRVVEITARAVVLERASHRVSRSL